MTAILLLAAVALVVAGGPTTQAFSHGVLSMLTKIVEWPIAVVLVLLAFALIYFFAPAVKEQKWHWVTPGAITGLGLWVVVSVGLKVYLHYFNRSFREPPF